MWPMLKKLAIAAFIFLCFSGAVFAQANCLNESVNNFSGTSGATPTSTTLQGTQYGVSGTYTVNGSVTYQTGAYYPIPDPTGVLCGTSASYAGNSSTTGIQIAGTGTNTSKNVEYNWSGNTGISQASASVWWCPSWVLSTYSGAPNFAVDEMQIKSNGGDYANIHVVAANGHISVNGESTGE